MCVCEKGFKKSISRQMRNEKLKEKYIFLCLFPNDKTHEAEEAASIHGEERGLAKFNV